MKTRFATLAVPVVGMGLVGAAHAGLNGLSYEIVGVGLVGELNDAGIENWTVRIYADTNAGDQVNAVAGNDATNKVVSASHPFYQHSAGGPTSLNINSALFGVLPDVEWDSYVTIGSLYSDGTPFGGNDLNSVGIDWGPFEAGGTLSVDNGTWFVTPGTEQGYSQAHTPDGCDAAEVQGVLIGQFTIEGGIGSSISFEGLFQGREADGTSPWQTAGFLTVTYSAPGADCNNNGVDDACDIENGTSQDADGDGIPDECADCNDNGTPDHEDIDNGTSADCNGNGVPDECDVDSGGSNDCDGNGVPDECQGDDCDGNGVPDSCDIADGAADCDNNGVLDSCDIDNGAADCNANDVPDSCDVDSGNSEDCDGDGTPDECETDSDGDGVIDDCEISPYHNLHTGEIHLTAAESIFAAEDGNHIAAMSEYFNAEDSVDFTGKAVRMIIDDNGFDSDGDITMAPGAELMNTVGGELRGSIYSGFSGNARIAAEADLTTAGMIFVRSGAGLEFHCPTLDLTGDSLVMSGGSLGSFGPANNSGSMTTLGDAVVAAQTLSNTGLIRSSGTYVTDLDNDGTLQCNNDTVLSGSLDNDGTVSVNVGTLYVLGNLTNNGVMLGDVDTGPGLSGGEPGYGDGFNVNGHFTVGADSSLTMPHANWMLSVGGNVDIAIDDHDRFVMDDATLAMTGMSGNAQNIEAMSLDVDSSTTGIDRSIDGHFPLGTLVIRAGTDVTVVDTHDNALDGDANETIYVRNLVIEAGAVFRTGDRTVWYETVVNDGTVDGTIDEMADPCPGDADGNGHVNIDDILSVLSEWGSDGSNGGDTDGNGIVNIDDLLMIIGNWGPCSNG